MLLLRVHYVARLFLGKRKRKQLQDGIGGLKMAENKKWKSISVNIMDEVAALKGKELNEPFLIESSVHKVAKRVRFTEKGMEYFDDMCQRWYPTEAFLREILTGQAVEIDE